MCNGFYLSISIDIMEEIASLFLLIIIGQSWLSDNLGFGSDSVCVCLSVCHDRNRTLKLVNRFLKPVCFQITVMV